MQKSDYWDIFIIIKQASWNCCTLIRAASHRDPPCIVKKTSVPIRRIIGEYKQMISAVFVCFPLQQCVAQYLLLTIVCVCRGRVDLDWIPRCVKEQTVLTEEICHWWHIKAEKKKTPTTMPLCTLWPILRRFPLALTRWHSRRISPCGGTPQPPLGPLKCQTLNTAFLGSHCYGYL